MSILRPEWLSGDPEVDMWREIGGQIAFAKAAIAQRIEGRSDETPDAVQPEGREPDGEADAPNLGSGDTP